MLDCTQPYSKYELTAQRYCSALELFTGCFCAIEVDMFRKKVG
jgi:hypothetical protein